MKEKAVISTQLARRLGFRIPQYHTSSVVLVDRQELVERATYDRTHETYHTIEESAEYIARLLTKASKYF